MPPLVSLLIAASSGLSWAQDDAALHLARVTFTADQVGSLVSPTFGDAKQNQPGVVNGRLFAGGNAVHLLADVRDPFAPVVEAVLESPHHAGEAESHQLAFVRGWNERIRAATISGRGVDLWDLTDLANPHQLAALELDGIRYGDNTEAVWGLAWDGRWLFVGGTSTGLWVVDTAEVTRPEVVARLTVAELGGVSAGPLWSMGNLLVVTTPKDHKGVATVDIGVPDDPVLLDAEIPDVKSYIGGFYGAHAWLLSPLRAYDVLTDPAAITLTSSTATLATEYVSFADGSAWIGRLRPVPGVERYDVTDPAAPVKIGELAGRTDDEPLHGYLTDDQFSFPLGNVVVLCDDEVRHGCVLAAAEARPDTTPQEVLAVWPPDESVGQPVTTRVGLSLADVIDVATLDPEDLRVQPLGGDPVVGSWGVSGTVLTFSPRAPLEADTTYEVIVPAGGLTDLFGNAVGRTTSSTFSTGAELVRVPCAVDTPAPVAVGEATTWAAGDAGQDASYAWRMGDEVVETGRRAGHVFDAPGRYTIWLDVTRDGVRRACTTVQVVHRVLPEGRPTTASTIAFDAAGRRVLVVNPDADSVTALDADTRQVLWERRVGDAPRTLALGPDDTVWVADQDSDDVTVLALADGSPVVTIPLRHGGAPYGVAVAPDGERAYVTLQGSGELVVLSTREHRELGRVALPAEQGRPQVRGLALSADGATAWVTRFVSPAAQGEVFEVDTARFSVRRTLALAYDETPDDHDRGRGVPSYLSSIALSPDGARAAIPGKKDNLSRGLARDGERLDSDNTVRTVVSFLDLGAGAEAGAERIDLDDHDAAFAATYSPRGDLVFVVSQGVNRVDVRDAYDGRPVTAASTGLAPNGLVLDDAGRLWVQDMGERTVSVFDAATVLDGSDPRLRLLGSVPTVAVEPLEPEVLLGKQLFHNAASGEMSQDGYLSCATCHLDGHDDGQVWDFTDRGEGLRNTIDLRGRAGTAHGPLHWSANFDEIQDFEHDIRNAFGGRASSPTSCWWTGSRTRSAPPRPASAPASTPSPPTWRASTPSPAVPTAPRTAASPRTPRRARGSSTSSTACRATRATSSPTAPRACATTSARCRPPQASASAVRSTASTRPRCSACGPRRPTCTTGRPPPSRPCSPARAMAPRTSPRRSAGSSRASSASWRASSPPWRTHLRPLAGALRVGAVPRCRSGCCCSSWEGCGGVATPRRPRSRAPRAADAALGPRRRSPRAPGGPRAPAARRAAPPRAWDPRRDGRTGDRSGGRSIPPGRGCRWRAWARCPDRAGRRGRRCRSRRGSRRGTRCRRRPAGGRCAPRCPARGPTSPSRGAPDPRAGPGCRAAWAPDPPGWRGPGCAARARRRVPTSPR
ncbi:MAG: Ig-like domain-containing protein [Alphaproteobacteria bacterium]|nr:Ig-like domain-containing protein [Alphaproteobacteria bacterium]